MRWVAIGAGVIAIGALASVSFAQPDGLAAQRDRLILAKQESARAAARSARLTRLASDERDAAKRTAARRVAVEARVESARADLATARARVAVVDRLLDAQRGVLAEHQGPVAHMLAALQSLARRPTIVAIAQPGSVDDLVHVRAVLGSALPIVRARTAAIRGDIAQSRALRGEAATAARGVRDGQARLLGERRALAALELDQTGRAETLGRTALVESDKAIALGEAAQDIVDQMATIDDQRETEARLIDLPGPPSVKPPTMPGAYRLPVSGQLVTGLGEISENGVRARGLTLAVAAGSTVRAPAGGRIAAARAFRGYGRIIVIDHGAGWTTLVTGLDTVAVRTGQRVGRGIPIGVAGQGEAPQVTVELRRRGRPVDITALIA